MVFTTQLCKLPFSYTKGHTFQGVWLENPHENKPPCLQCNMIIKLLVEKGADSIYMNFRYETSSLCMNCDVTFPLMDTKRQRIKMKKHWQKEKRQSIIYQNYCLRSFHSVCAPEFNFISSEEHICHLLLSRLQTCSFAAFSWIFYNHL